MANSLIRWLVDPSGLTPHGFCLLWQPGLIWTYAASDLTIGAAYFSIPAALALLLRQRRELAFRPLFWLFAAFVLLCGITHWLDLLTLWIPAYGVQALTKAATAAVSVVTAIVLWRLLPLALALPSSAEFRKVNEALRKSEEFLERTGRVAGIGGWERDLLTGEVTWSAETCRLLGVAPDYKPKQEELVNFYAPEARQIALAAMTRATSGGGGWDLKLPFLRADGRKIWARSVATVESAAGKPIRLSGSIQDMTAQRAARLELKDALERLILAADAGHVGIWDWDVTTDQIVWDPWMYRLYGHEPRDEPASYELWTRHLHPDDRAAAEQAVRDGADGKALFDTEFRIVWNDGSIHHIRAAAKVTLDSTGRATSMVGTNWDITESRELAAELVRRAGLQAEAAELEMALFRNSPDSLAVIRVEEDASGAAFIYEAFSPAHKAVTGMQSEELIGRRPEACLPPDMSGTVLSRYGRCLAEGKTITYSDTYMLPVGTRDFEGSVTPVRNPATGRVVRLVGAMRDVTDRNQMESTLRHAQKMEAIGRLSAGVAHDFNNILQGIVGGLELVLDEATENTPVHEFASAAINSAMRGASLTQHLLSYARKQLLRPQTVDVAPLLAETKTLLMRTLGPQIAISVGETRTAAILADPGQLQTALLNLAINSSHAMPQGGTISFDVQIEHGASEAWVVIAVTDTGSGMDATTLAQATEPFFTTKGLEGSGLGLSMVQGFVEQSGGRFQIISAPGDGTTVELRLPLVASATHREQPKLVKIERANHRILLVDDSPDVLVTTSAFLEKAGFTVVRADSGENALALLVASGHFDVIVSDYAMRGVNGADLIADARIIQPGLKALLITGYAIDSHRGALPADVPLLHKPFKRVEFIQTLHCILERGQDVGCKTSSECHAPLASNR